MPVGAKGKPNFIKRLEGNRSRRLIPQEIQGRGRLVMPAGLKEEEAEIWADIVRSLPDGLLMQTDAGALERMSVAWARYRECQRHIRKHGLIDKFGKPNSMAYHQEKAATEMHRLTDHLGLSPLARNRILAQNQPDDDPLELLLAGRKDGAYHQPAPTRKAKTPSAP